MNPFVFVVGCPRSGTTLLQRMLDAHPRLAIMPESHWIPRWYVKRTGITADGRATPELLARLLERPRFTRLQLPMPELKGLLDRAPRPTYAEFVTGVFDLYGERIGKQLVGDKTPSYVRWLPTLHELWPSARFIHLIRDGRDVCLSVLAWRKVDRALARFETFSEHPVETAAFWWETNVRLGRTAGAALPGDLYAEVRYEDLVAEPERELQRLADFLGVSFDNAMVSYHERRERPEPGLSAKDAWLRPTAGLRDWRAQMTEDAIVEFEAAAGELLDELGYQRGAKSNASARSNAARLRDRFAGNERGRRFAKQRS